MITVHDRELCKRALGYDIKETVSLNRESSPKSAKISTPLCINQSQSQLLRAQEWLSRKARRNVISLPDNPEVKEVKEICNKLHQEEKDILQEIDQFLLTETHSKERKKEMLYEKWKQQVFNPLHSSLRVALDLIVEYNDIQRRQLFDRYICIRDKKDVFLDIIDINEYNPFRLHYITSKAQIPHLRDPLLEQQQNYKEELEIIEGATPTCLGRSDTNAVLWLAMELIQIDSDIRQRSRVKSLDTQTQSHIEGGTIIEGVAPDKEPHLPHKRKIIYPKQEEFTLEWEQYLDTTT